MKRNPKTPPREKKPRDRRPKVRRIDPNLLDAIVARTSDLDRILAAVAAAVRVADARGAGLSATEVSGLRARLAGFGGLIDAVCSVAAELREHAVPVPDCATAKRGDVESGPDLDAEGLA
jgi:hypothetical protein